MQEESYIYCSCNYIHDNTAFRFKETIERYFTCNYRCRGDHQECVQGSISPCYKNFTGMVYQG
nr:hypothetical protein Iba_chr14dCG10420 [Ipomoea batatas]